VDCSFQFNQNRVGFLETKLRLALAKSGSCAFLGSLDTNRPRMLCLARLTCKFYSENQCPLRHVDVHVIGRVPGNRLAPISWKMLKEKSDLFGDGDSKTFDDLTSICGSIMAFCESDPSLRQLQNIPW